MGFVAHRGSAIVERKFLHRGFDRPEQLYQRSQQRQIQKGIKAALGFSQGTPLATTSFSYNQNSDTTLEATDSKVMPRCRVDYEIGARWNINNKSYSSYDICYQAQDIRLDAERHEFYPLEVKVGMGINLHPAGSEKTLPKISFIHRNQILMWVSDPISRSRIRGIVVLMSSYMDDISTKKKLSIYEREELELSTGSLARAKEEEHKPGTISLSIAQVQNQGATSSNKSRAGVSAVISKFVQRSPASPVTCIPRQEYLARGWDASNNTWRSVVWPELDKHFRAAGFEKTPQVWKIQCPWENTGMVTGIPMQP
ncbi:hypothetical protein C8F04DRAFT_1104252 [Mycena alexandri]|uniref:Uncharacterized protein n=1 Tax=Mycena alexandri TaxID=1745969 RepID=A0AAD6X1V7_9AGAR|nr:hypothetical protein C8F04DRAFT_1104252 [Mycena alexandri]